MKPRFILLLVIVLLVIPEWSAAQCAMCKAVVESNAIDENNAVGGVNNGIMYLMGVPYFLMLVIGIIWYKKNK